jgi:hypothetical protein
MNYLYGGNELGCTAEVLNVDGEVKGTFYNPVLGKDSPREDGATWHCAD